MLVGRDISVRFGGVEAVSEATVLVHPDEIVGLIGTNGAGKSTFMNAVGGYVSSSGRVELLGRDITRMSAPQRARAGLGRTFQTAALFPELTVRETVQVALEARGRTPLLSTALHLPHHLRPGAPSALRGRRAHRPSWGWGRYADSYISDLSTGTRRIVEITGALGPRRPGAVPRRAPPPGWAQRETEAFGAAYRQHPPGAGRGHADHRARHAPHHEHQRPGVPAWRPAKSLPREAPPRCATTPW